METILEILHDKEEAIERMHVHARRIARWKVTGRYGVSVRELRGAHREPVWAVILHDRKTRPPGRKP